MSDKPLPDRIKGIRTGWVNRVTWHEGDVCHKLRRLCGWTVEKLAKEATLNPSVIYRLEDGRTKDPKRQTIEAIARAFQLTLREFRDSVPPGDVRIPRSEQQTAPRRSSSG